MINRRDLSNSTSSLLKVANILKIVAVILPAATFLLFFSSAIRSLLSTFKALVSPTDETE